MNQNENLLRMVLLIIGGIIVCSAIGYSAQIDYPMEDPQIESPELIPDVPLPTIIDLPSNIQISKEPSLNMFNRVHILPGEVHDGDVVIFAGSGLIEGIVNGDVVVFGGNAVISGTIDGDLVIFGGQTQLSDTASVSKNLVIIGGDLERAEGAVIGHEAVHIGQTPSFPLFKNMQFQNYLFLILKGIILLWWLVIGFLLILLSSRHIDQSAMVMRSEPLSTLMIGLLFCVATAISAVILAITIIGSMMVILLGIIVYIFAVPVGFVTLGRLILEQFKRHDQPILMAGFIGFLVLSIISFIPYGIGFSIWILWAMAAMGAVIRSKFGTMKPWLTRRNNSEPIPSSSIVSASQSLDTTDGDSITSK